MWKGAHQMPKHRTLTLNPEQYQELATCRDHDKRSYMRERAAALIKIAEGMKPAHVADHGLLRRRDPDTVYTWLDRYEREGLPGLVNRKGRGRKPAFSPCLPERGKSERGALARHSPRATLAGTGADPLDIGELAPTDQRFPAGWSL